MALHLLKLSVGAESVADLRGYIEARVAERRRTGGSPVAIHTTRMMPKRVDELLDGGALFWVIKGQISARQTILAVEPFTDAEGVGRCRLHLDPEVVAVLPRPCRPFQGWRYLQESDRPADLAGGWEGLAVMPEEMRRELRDLCLL
jgi:hypothetical protein